MTLLKNAWHCLEAALAHCFARVILLKAMTNP